MGQHISGWLLGLTLLSTLAGAAQARALRVGDRLPAFVLSTIEGSTISSARAKNRAIWLTFFHST